VSGVSEDLLKVPDLYDLSQVHDRNPIHEILNDSKIMSNQKICQPKLFLQFLEQIQDLRLY
jgi:hypothetical protein